MLFLKPLLTEMNRNREAIYEEALLDDSFALCNFIFDGGWFCFDSVLVSVFISIELKLQVSNFSVNP